ncbi:hypothetical protein GQ54DRAFT_307936 [Martensiomyces pterosporus]|nr:hypothetical protein GQ54DRAFT_307936 [Martensiomyces pterosporus]
MASNHQGYSQALASTAAMGASASAFPLTNSTIVGMSSRGLVPGALAAPTADKSADGTATASSSPTMNAAVSSPQWEQMVPSAASSGWLTTHANAASSVATSQQVGSPQQAGGRKRSAAAAGKSKAKPAGGERDGVIAGGIGKTKARGSSALHGTSSRMSKGSDSTAEDESDGHRDGSDAADGNVNSEEQRRRRRFLERNRIAASKCRQKKKLWIQELERRAEDVTMQNRSLHLAVAQLKEEVIVLKNQLLAHRNCGCSAIQQFLQTDCTGGTVAQAATAAVAAAAVAGFPLATQPQQSLTSPPQPPLAPQLLAQQQQPHAPMLLIQQPPLPHVVQQQHQQRQRTASVDLKVSQNPAAAAAAMMATAPAVNIAASFSNGMNPKKAL